MQLIIVDIITIILLLPMLFSNLYEAVEINNIIQQQTFTTDAIDDSSITILNWNIHKESVESTWIKDYQSLVSEFAPDIVTLQEALPHLPAHIHKGVGYIFAANVADRSGTQSGVMTLSEASPLYWDYALTSNREPIANTPKVRLGTDYQLTPSQKILKVINVHGINFVTTQKFSLQIDEIESTIAHHNGPVLLMGDFNTWIAERLTILNAVAIRQGLSPVLFDKDEQKEIKRFINHPLDHIYYSSDLELHHNSSQVLSSIKSSDHTPMVVTFRIRES